MVLCLRSSANKPFAWRAMDRATSHVGLPPVYDFPFVPITAAQL